MRNHDKAIAVHLQVGSCFGTSNPALRLHSPVMCNMSGPVLCCHKFQLVGCHIGEVGKKSARCLSGLWRVECLIKFALEWKLKLALEGQPTDMPSGFDASWRFGCFSWTQKPQNRNL